VVAEPAYRADDALWHALPQLVEARGLDLPSLGRRAGFRPGYLERLADGLVAEPSEGVVEALARALDMSPASFLEYRLRRVLDRIDRDVNRLNALFRCSLQPLEQSAVERDRTSDERLRKAVADLLAEQDLTQGDLAHELGWSQSHVSRLLASRFPSLELLEAVALALGVEPHHFREYRSHVVQEWLRSNPAILNELFDELSGASEPAPYVPPEPGRSPPVERMRPSELLATLLELIAAEGSVIGRRVYRAIMDGRRSEPPSGRSEVTFRELVTAMRAAVKRAITRALRPV
jgi:transcriptional regulator with XRE-family HTH domain